ncbi:MAG: dihydroorotase [Bdellovibrionales bacterium]|nr:dihydroorotase [Bdellovibrionales bacterium]
MNDYDLVIKDGIGIFPHPTNSYELIEEQTDIGIRDGHIVKVGFIEKSKCSNIFSAKNLYVLPGLMDCQVHFREPGMTHKEDFETGSKSALLGGITGVFEMPNTSPPTTHLQALNEKLERAKNRFYCDYAFFVGASPENKNNLHELEKSKGCCGVKVFMGSSTGNLLLDKVEDLEIIVKNGKRRMAVHSEDEARLIERKQFIQEGKVETHALWRDEQTAFNSTKRLIQLAEKYQRPVHVLHVTTEEEMEFLSQHKKVASVEVTPQHLTLCAPECYHQLGALAQMNPPIRSSRHFKALWKGVQNGTVDIIGSDHAPHTLEEKNKIYPNTPSGMPGVQTLLPLLLNHRHQGKLNLQTIVRLLAMNPHHLFKMKKRGLIQEGFLANLTIIDLKKEQRITKDWLAYKCGWSPFENLKVTGWPTAVFLRGQLAMRDSEIINSAKGQEIAFLD